MEQDLVVVPQALPQPPSRKVLLIGSPSAQVAALERRLSATAHVTRVIDPFVEGMPPLTALVMLEEALEAFRPQQLIVCPGPIAILESRALAPALAMQQHLLVPAQAIDLAFRAGVRELLMVTSTAVYPGGPTGPNAEEDLLMVRPALASFDLAVAHAACLRMCEAYSEQYGDICGVDFRALVAADAYGPGDESQATAISPIASLIDRLCSAQQQGQPSLELPGGDDLRQGWLFADDFAEACLHVMALAPATYRRHTQAGFRHLNASGQVCSVREVADTIAQLIGYKGQIRTSARSHTAEPDQLLDDYRLRQTGWRPRTTLAEGLRRTLAARPPSTSPVRRLT